jgi:hypothetical protein
MGHRAAAEALWAVNYGYPIAQLILGPGFRPIAVWQPRRKVVSSKA